jgi:hypothetical protein
MLSRIARASSAPREPTAGRVYVWRKLKQLGAIAVQDAVWVLPVTPRTQEQFQWLASEIDELGGRRRIGSRKLSTTVETNRWCKISRPASTKPIATFSPGSEKRGVICRHSPGAIRKHKPASIARIIDEAATVQEVSVEAAAPGLDLICEGIRRTSPDDQTALERGALIYDALYAQLESEML